jgi:hypothetical protein
MEELAQSVGNEKIPGEFDWDAATAGAAFIGVTDSLISQIRAQTVALPRNFWRVSKPVSACFSQGSDLVFLHPRRDTFAKK